MTYEEYKNNKKETSGKSIFKTFMSKLFTIVIFTMLVVIISNYSPKFRNFVTNKVLNSTIDFSFINKFMNKTTNVFKNNDVIFNTPKTETVNNVPVVNSSYTPTDEKLSIGEINPVYKTLPNPNTQVNNGGFYRSSNNNAAFIKLPMIILVLLLSTIIGVGISIFMLK